MTRSGYLKTRSTAIRMRAGSRKLVLHEPLSVSALSSQSIESFATILECCVGVDATSNAGVDSFDAM